MLRTGLTRESSLQVTDGLTVPEVSPSLTAFAGMPRVFATAYMIGLAEAVCVELLQEHLGEEKSASVGVGVEMTHIAPTLPGMTVTAEAVLIEIDGAFLTFRVELRDGAGVIGQGSHRRALIDREKFLARAAKRKAAAGTAG